MFPFRVFYYIVFPNVEKKDLLIKLKKSLSTRFFYPLKVKLKSYSFIFRRRVFLFRGVDKVAVAADPTIEKRTLTLLLSGEIKSGSGILIEAGGASEKTMLVPSSASPLRLGAILYRFWDDSPNRCLF